MADALSRINTILMPTILDPKTIQEAQLEDEELLDLIQRPTSIDLQEIKINEDITIDCDVTQNVVRPYLPKSLRRAAYEAIHNPSHYDRKTTSLRLRQKFVWPNIKKDAINWSRECLACQRAKVQRHNRLLPNHIDVPDTRFSHIHIDLIHLPEVKGYKYCLTVIDRFTRWPVTVPLKDISAETVTTALFDNWKSHYGTPITITSDQGPKGLNSSQHCFKR